MGPVLCRGQELHRFDGGTVFYQERELQSTEIEKTESKGTNGIANNNEEK